MTDVESIEGIDDEDLKVETLKSLIAHLTKIKANEDRAIRIETYNAANIELATICAIKDWNP